MSTTWILVAQRAGAKLYEHRKAGGPLALVREFPHPEGRLKDREIETDRPGRSYESQGVRSSSYTREVSAHEELALHFARELGEMLGSARAKNEYGRLVLVAEPRFLGLLRESLDPRTNDVVVGTVNKQLDATTPRELAEHLAGVINVGV